MSINQWISTVSLNSEIKELEQQLQQRKILVSLQKESFKQCLWEKLTSPQMILIAAGTGFLFGYLSLRRDGVPAEGKISKLSSLILSVTNVLMITGTVMDLFTKGAAPNADSTTQDK